MDNSGGYSVRQLLTSEVACMLQEGPRTHSVADVFYCCKLTPNSGAAGEKILVYESSKTPCLDVLDGKALKKTSFTVDVQLAQRFRSTHYVLACVLC